MCVSLVFDFGVEQVGIKTKVEKCLSFIAFIWWMKSLHELDRLAQTSILKKIPIHGKSYLHFIVLKNLRIKFTHTKLLDVA